MTEKPVPLSRRDFRYFNEITTRWSDNDAYHHVNNIYYYSFFDTTVSGFLHNSELVDYRVGDIVGMTVNSTCDYFASIAFPDRVVVGLRAIRIGTSSVTYELAIFRNDETRAAAQGRFVHVYVDRETQRPVAMSQEFRAKLDAIRMDHST